MLHFPLRCQAGHIGLGLPGFGFGFLELGSWARCWGSVAGRSILSLISRAEGLVFTYLAKPALKRLLANWSFSLPPAGVVGGPAGGPGAGVPAGGHAGSCGLRRRRLASAGGEGSPRLTQNRMDKVGCHTSSFSMESSVPSKSGAARTAASKACLRNQFDNSTASFLFSRTGSITFVLAWVSSSRHLVVRRVLYLRNAAGTT